MINPLNGWIVNPSILQLIHPMYNSQQQYGKDQIFFVLFENFPR